MSRIIPVVSHSGARIPLLSYGTAWKTTSTDVLTKTALEHGFRAVDTANHPTGYEEALTGDGIKAALENGLKREELWIQTKFTPVFGHDAGKIPFNPNQPIEEQARESIQQSFEHLKVDYIDSLLLHAPYDTLEDNLKAWSVFETFVPHKIREIGVSNIGLPMLEKLYEQANVKPAFVQNRFYLQTQYDIELRKFTRSRGIIYQAFWMLRNCPEILSSEVVHDFAKVSDVEKELAFYVLIAGLGGVQILDGTTKEDRMDNDLAIFDEMIKEQDIQEQHKGYFERFETFLQDLVGKQTKSEL